jgi:3-oxoacyl-[acyl-carrier protein] reductase
MPEVICITGASRGIGRYLASYYLEREMKVIGCSRGESDLQHLNYHHEILDVSNEGSVVSLFRTIRKTYGQLDVLINNAGINPTIGPLALTSADAFQSTVQVNLMGTFLMTRSAIKIMMKKHFGRIINFGSMATRHEVAGEACYTATKAAVVAMSRVIAKETYPQGITCNVVSPAALKTGLTAKIEQAALQDVLNRNAIPEYGDMDDVSNVVDWLIQKESAHITGQEFFLGGA